MTKLRRIALWTTLAVVAIGLAGALSFDFLLLNVPPLIEQLRNPVGPNHAVTWERGPAPTLQAGEPTPPNIILIVADDLGYNDLTLNGGGVAGGVVPTPNINSIARDGVEFTRGYSGNATCAPSRAAIMTGRFATRFGYEFTPVLAALAPHLARQQRNAKYPPIYFEDRAAAVPPLDEQGLPAEETTIAELLRDKGYRTLGIGKWHLGTGAPLRPEAQGFDEYLGFLRGGSLYLPVGHADSVEARQDFNPADALHFSHYTFAVSEEGGKHFEPDSYMTDYLADEAAEAIAANRNRPFFLYLAFNAPHTPLQALRSDYDALPEIKDHALRTYAAMIRALDRGVGRVLDALRTNGLEENTLVLFTADNGAPHYIGLPDVNYPYRGWKATFFEGGIHVPLFAKWPDGLPHGRRVDTPAAHVDLFATAAAAAGATLPSDRIIDGTDLVRLAREGEQGSPPRTLFWRSGHYRAVLVGDWKLQRSERPEKTWLFDLRADPTERKNLAEARPEKVAEISAILAAYEAEMVEPNWPALLEVPVTIDHPLNRPFEADDELVFWAN